MKRRHYELTTAQWEKIQDCVRSAACPWSAVFYRKSNMLSDILGMSELTELPTWEASVSSCLTLNALQSRRNVTSRPLQVRRSAMANVRDTTSSCDTE